MEVPIPKLRTISLVCPRLWENPEHTFLENKLDLSFFSAAAPLCLKPHFIEKDLYLMFTLKLFCSAQNGLQSLV